MPQLSSTNKERILMFIHTRQASKLPHVDLRAVKNNTIHKSILRASQNPDCLVFYGCDGANRSNHFLLLNGKAYVLTFDFNKLVEYAYFKRDHYE